MPEQRALKRLGKTFFFCCFDCIVLARIVQKEGLIQWPLASPSRIASRLRDHPETLTVLERDVAQLRDLTRSPGHDTWHGILRAFMYSS